MIVKISRDRGTKTRSASARAIVAYICRIYRSEKPRHIGSANLIAESLKGQAAEMAALAACAVRSRNPVQHAILSWPEGERPSPEQADEAARIYLRTLDMTHHQAIWALHTDTATTHLHIALNRTDPETERARKINGGWDIKAAHQAIALIEHTQGWKSEKGALYEVRDQRVSRREPQLSPEVQPAAAARDYEHRTGQRSAQGTAIETLGPLIEKADSWAELHHALAAHGATYERKGSGAIIKAGGVAIKASSVSRAAALGSLTKRLGPMPASDPAEAQQGAARTLSTTTSGPARQELDDYPGLYAMSRESRRKALRSLREQQAEALARLKEQQAKERLALIQQRSWKGHGLLLQALRSVLAQEHKAAVSALKTRYAHEVQALRKRLPAAKSYSEWLSLSGRPDLAEQWRKRHGKPFVRFRVEGNEGATTGFEGLSASHRLITRTHKPEIRPTLGRRIHTPKAQSYWAKRALKAKLARDHKRLDALRGLGGKIMNTSQTPAPVIVPQLPLPAPLPPEKISPEPGIASRSRRRNRNDGGYER